MQQRPQAVYTREHNPIGENQEDFLWDMTFHLGSEDQQNWPSVERRGGRVFQKDMSVYVTTLSGEQQRSSVAGVEPTDDGGTGEVGRSPKQWEAN